MFHLVRHWWTGGRGKVTLRLFLFEFVVVVLGVLAAQGLANWVQQRGERDEGERLLASTMGDLRTFQQILNYWGQFGPCLRQHVADLGRVAAAGGSVPIEEIGRPSLPNLGDTTMSAEDQRKLRIVVTPDRADAIMGFLVSVKAYNVKLESVAAQWPALALLDGTSGPPSAEDRSRARLAATTIDNELRWMAYIHRVQKAEFPSAGLPVSDDLGGRDEVVDDCGLLKDWR